MKTPDFHYGEVYIWPPLIFSPTPEFMPCPAAESVLLILETQDFALHFLGFINISPH